MAGLDTLAPTEQRTFSVEEVGEVIRTASALTTAGASGLAPAVRERLGFAELLEVARELGIPEAMLRQAIPEAEARRRRAVKRTKRKMRFYRHLITWTLVCGGLGALNFLTHGPPWSGVVALLWGIPLAMHGFRTFVTGKDGRLHQAVYRRELEAERRGE